MEERSQPLLARISACESVKRKLFWRFFWQNIEFNIAKYGEKYEMFTTDLLIDSSVDAATRKSKLSLEHENFFYGGNS